MMTLEQKNMMTLEKKNMMTLKKKKVMQSLSVQSTSRRRCWRDTKAGMVEEEAEEAEQKEQEDVGAQKAY